MNFLQEKLRLLDTPKTHHGTMSCFYQSKKVEMKRMPTQQIM